VYILLAAVLGLYIIQFSNTDQTVDNIELSDSSAVETNTPKQGLIYYVNTDTIWDQYDYVQDALAELGSRKKQYESRLEKQYRSFEAEVTEFQQRGSTMSEVELQIKQRDLMRKEGELNKLKEELEIKILTEEKEWNDKLRAKIVGYIDSYTQDRNYDYILGYSITSNIILANDSLNLTSAVLSGLNEDYRAQKEVE
jgi:outer membrane protein